MRRRPGVGRQRGVVLVAILVLFALAAVIAVEVTHRQDHFRARTENLIGWDKRYRYAVAAETVAIQGLIDDLEADSDDGEMVDDCGNEQWAVSLPPTPYADAMLTATVQDLQARFNLNWLVTFDTDGNAYVRDEARRDQLERLLQTLLEGQGVAPSLADEMADWLDSDNLVNGVQGAEDPDYRLRRTPNMPILHESELRALRSFAPQAITAERFWQYFTALPLDARLNVNTAPERVMDAVFSQYGAAGLAAAIVSQRDSAPFKSTQDVMALAPVSDLPADKREALEAGIDVRSEYFQVMVDIRDDVGTTRLVSRIMRRAQGDTAVYSRAVLPIISALEPACHPDYNAGSEKNNEAAGAGQPPGGSN